MQKKQKEKRIFLVMNTIIPMVLGGVLYYLFCPDIHFVKRIDMVIGGGIHFSYLRKPFLIFLRNYLFDFLWAYSFSSAMSAIVDNRIARLIVPTLFVCGLEVLQNFVSRFGTFDFGDIYVEICAVFIVWLEIYLRGKEDEKV